MGKNINESKLTRIEVITSEGREFVSFNSSNEIELSVQDEGRTLKIFIKKRKKQENYTPGWEYHD